MDIVKLDFQFDDSTVPTPDQEPLRVLQLVDQYYFRGTIKFVVNDVEFFERTEVLFYAWLFRGVHRWIELDLVETPFEIAPSGGGFHITFSKTEGAIKIDSRFAYLAPGVIQAQTTTAVNPAELSYAFKSFYRRVYRKASKLYPPIKCCQLFQDWLYSDVPVR